MATKKKTNNPVPVILDKESAKAAGLKVLIRRRDGSTVDALSDTSSDLQMLAKTHSDKAIKRLAELVDHAQPEIALRASELLLRLAHPTVPTGSVGADRVHGCDRFDRAGTGEDSTFRARLEPEDIRILSKALKSK